MTVKPQKLFKNLNRKVHAGWNEGTFLFDKEQRVGVVVEWCRNSYRILAVIDVPDFRLDKLIDYPFRRSAADWDLVNRHIQQRTKQEEM